MFDAALGESMQEPLVEGFDALHAIQVEETPLFLVPPSLESFQEGLRAAERSIKSQLSEANLHDLLQLFPGTEWQNDSDRGQRLASALGAIIHGELSFSLLPMEGASRATAISAFSPNGPGGAPTIFVNPFWFDSLGEAQATSVLLEEIGHALDNILNGENDSPGDEGRAFARAVLGYDALESLGFANDHGTVTYGGVEYAAEFASFSFVNAYEMLTDRDGDDTVDNTENWAEKEQETHTLVVANNGTDADKGGLGPAIINDDTDSASFSGNDVVAIGIDIDGTTYFGWISRPLKVQGEVVGFYFWTDQNFTTLALAQADGNQDGDRNVTDNKGFILVVDQTYFTDKIAAGLAPITVQASSVYSAQPAGTYNTIEVKSSSDRVDSALNSLAPTNSPAALVANNDLASGVPGVSGGAALEEGADNNTSSLNGPLTGAGNLVDAIAATGNVLDNDANSDGVKPTAVRSVSSALSGQSSGVALGGSATLSGAYGALTLNSDGSYSYTVDDSLAEVDALLPTSTALQDQFEYTVSDGLGNTVSATLTIEIDGSNDAPVAVDDTNIAKESLLTDSSAYSVSDTVGFVASGNVVTNDADVDHAEADRSIVGLTETGTATATGYTGGDGTSTALTFATSTNINSVSPGSTTYAFWDYDGDGSGGSAEGALAISSGGLTPTYSFVSVTSKTPGEAAGTTVIELSGIPSHYWNGSAWVAFTDVETELAAGSRVFTFGAARGNEAANSTKEGVLVVGGASTQISVDVSAATGSIFEGMSVTASSGGTSLLPAGTEVLGVTYDGSGQIVSIQISDDFVSDPTNASLNFSSPSGAVTFTTAYGTLVLDSSGAYTYTPIAANALLGAGESVVESFDYQMQDALGAKSAATLSITVLGSGTSDPAAVDDSISASEAGGVANGTAGLNPTAFLSPNRVLDNDTAATGFATKVLVAASSLLTGNSDTAASSSLASDPSSNPAVIVGRYGTLTLGADGSYAYEVNNSLDEVQALRISSDQLFDTFSYQVNNLDGGSVVGGSDFATITVTISGANDAPVSAGDTLISVVGRGTVATNVLSNDLDVDAGDTQTLTYIQAGSTTSPGTSVVGPTSVVGLYGTLIVSPDGSASYSVDPSQVEALGNGQEATPSDIFSYEMEDAGGLTSVATIAVRVFGQNDSPVNSLPSVITTSLNTAIVFSGTDLVSVSDLDGNLASTFLEVDNGALALVADGALVLTFFDEDGADPASTGKAAVRASLSGTQSEINNTLASLSYTPDDGFTGTDFLTIVSQDSDNAFDSDSLKIVIPTSYSGPTVLESDLAGGSNPAGVGESATATFAAPTNQSFGTLTQSGSDTYGTWSLTSGGLFTYNLTSAPTISGASETRTIEIVSYDAFGNATTNTVTVTITDDAPTAHADGASVTEGTSGSPAANITGNVVTGAGTGSVADTASADTPLTVTKVGTTSANGAVTAGTTSADGTSVVGSYGTLVLGADGSYSYDLDDGNATVDGLATGSTLQDVFRYEATDGDGDSSVTTLTITIGGVTDTSPSLTVVDNNGAATGSESVAEDSSLTGKSFTVSAPAGLNKITVAGTDVTLAQLTGASATPVAVTTTEGTLTITGYNSGTGVVTYGFDPTGTSQDHSGGEVSDSISLGVTDSLGQTTSATLQILITDTAPTANADGASVTEGTSGSPAANITGNVVTGTGTGSVADTASADTPLTVTKVGTTSADGLVTAGTTSADGTSVVGSYGTLVLGADGSYSYDLDDGNATVDGLATGSTLQDVFRYEATDGDGDSSVTTLTITIGGVTDTSPSLTVVDNNGAATGSESVAEDSSLTGKSFTVSAPAGLNKITVAGTDVTLAQLTGASATPVAVTTTEGTLTITGYNSGTGLVTYGFDPTGTSQDHSGGEVSDSISLGVTDSLGQTTSATLQILITDTAPTANADGASVTEGTSGAPAANITGNVVTGAGTGSVADTASADTSLTIYTSDVTTWGRR
jgi:VCBS repeat-containing protein